MQILNQQAESSNITYVWVANLIATKSGILLTDLKPLTGRVVVNTGQRLTALKSLLRLRSGLKASFEKTNVSRSAHIEAFFVLATQRYITFGSYTTSCTQQVHSASSNLVSMFQLLNQLLMLNVSVPTYDRKFNLTYQDLCLSYDWVCGANEHIAMFSQVTIADFKRPDSHHPL